MRKVRGISSKFAIAVGVFLLIEGIWGHFSQVVFAFLTTNPLHAAIHVALGLLGILAGLKAGSRVYCVMLGLVLLTVGLLRLFSNIDGLIVAVLNVNPAAAWLNLILGVLSLLIGVFSRRNQPVVAY